jgi:hypothetical protein
MQQIVHEQQDLFLYLIKINFMETKPQSFRHEKSNGKTLDCTYYFAYVDTNKESNNIDLLIEPNDPDEPSLHNLRISVPKNIMEKDPAEIERIAKSELASYYIIKNASSNP